MREIIAGYLEKVRTTSALAAFSVLRTEEGRVGSIGEDVATVTGLMTARLNELLEFENGDMGLAYILDRDSIGVVLLRKTITTRAGDKVAKTGRVLSVGVGEELLGRVMDPLGNMLDGLPAPGNLADYPIEREAPPLVKRDYVTRPLYTGIKAIDAMLPIGRGQRELIIGDSATGKTSVAMSAVANQKGGDVVSVYACIGQKKDQVARIIEEIRRRGDPSRTVFVVADASDSYGLQFIAPYSAVAVAEFFMDRGRDVLVVYDDLTKHAMAYRSLSLLLRRPPGREAYPGDVFFIHSRLLERSACISGRYGGGSITALPIVETQQGRISSFIPTNLISITDGQIYLDVNLFNKGIRPAIDVGRSVSRIGGKAQTDAMRKVAGRMKLDYSRFLEAEVFTKFGAKVEDETARLIRRGERLRELFKQPMFRLYPMEDVVLGFLMFESGALDAAETADAGRICDDMTARIKEAMPDLVEKLRSAGRLSVEETNNAVAFFRRAAGDAGVERDRAKD
ncbi:MAG: F0F1 ATP synthase subunit alpha [Nitrospinae bacterium]|nr:F0F1 ATP synthase subunit alpha [Nitrospinota bacterium]